MLQAVHSQTATPATQSPHEAGAPEVFAPLLRLAMNESALLAAVPAQHAPGAQVTEALAASPRRMSAARHWASESLARAQGQRQGVNLAEIAAGELASPGQPRGPASAEPAPLSGRESHARGDGDPRADHGRSGARPDATPQRSAEASAEDQPKNESRSTPADRHAARAQWNHSIGSAGRTQGASSAAAAGASAAGQVGAQVGAIQGAGQAQGAPGGVMPAAASAWKLESVGRAGKLGGAGGPAHAQSPSRTIQSQMERGIGAVLRQGGGSLTLRLKPAELGEVRVQMIMQGGAVRARFESSSAEARELMTAGLGALRAALEARGLRVESLEVAADPHERSERPVAEPPRNSEQQQEAAPRHPSDPRGEGAGRGGGGDGDKSPQGDGGREAGDQRAEQAPEDPAHHNPADDAVETLVSLRLDTVA